MCAVWLCCQIIYSSVDFVLRFSLRNSPLSLPSFPMLPLTVHICNVLVEDGPDAAALRLPANGIATAATTGGEEPQVSL